MTKRLARPKLSDLILAAALLPASAIFLVPVDGFSWGCWTYENYPCPGAISLYLSQAVAIAVLAVIYRFIEAILPSNGKRPRFSRVRYAFVQLFTSPVTFLKSQFGTFAAWKWLLTLLLITPELQHSWHFFGDLMRTKMECHGHTADPKNEIEQGH